MKMILLRLIVERVSKKNRLFVIVKKVSKLALSTKMLN